MITKKLLHLVTSYACFINLNAQKSSRIAEHSDKIYYAEGKMDLIVMNEKKPVYENNIEAFLNTIVYSNAIQVKKSKTETDALGFTHSKFDLMINGTSINNAVVNVHSKDGKLNLINGDLDLSAKISNQIIITSSSALQSAKKYIGARKYKWENKTEENLFKKIFNNPGFTFEPKSEIVLFRSPENDNSTLSYAYKFDIYAEEPLSRNYVFVDAATGKILGKEELIHEIDVAASANTRFSSVQTMTVDNYGAGQYRLQETSKGLGVETYNMNSSQNYSAATDYTNTSTTWTATTLDQIGTDAHWGAEMVYNYFLNEHSRNSIDNAGHKLVSFANYGVGYANAFWNGVVMTYGSGGNGGFTGLDICGHEVSHGLTSKTAGLVYQNESGALNESYSDIFGTCIENFGKPSAFNWTMGEDVGGIRSMSNPNAYGDPDTYQGLNWYVGTGDNGGVHTNSGVSNYWFYLLCQGGTGINDVSSSYTVNAIGMNIAAKIAFRALTVYYTPSTNYASARNLSIQAAIDLYGACSNEVYQTKSAWYAVGVGPSPSGTATPIPNFVSTQSSPCSLPFVANFINTTYGGDSYIWDFGDGSALSTSQNPTHTYTNNGSYNVKLKASATCASTPDSIIKTAYIVINGLTASTATANSRCDTGAVVLTANGTDMQYWFANSTGTGTPLYVGNSFTTATLNNNTTFYVVNTATNPSIYGGPATTSIGAGAYFPSVAPYDSLSVTQPCTLKSVVVNASFAGVRTIELRNSTNTVLQSYTVNLPAGTSTVNLNFKLTPGYGYRLGLSGALGQLYRNNGGVTYPYNIGNLLSITGSSAGPGSFFFFYNWEVAPDNCTSVPTAVTATIHPKPIVGIIASQTLACVTDGPVSLTGTPTGGIYSGTSVTGNNFNPSIGTGTYSAIYSYTDAIGCENNASTFIVVSPCIGIYEYSNSNLIQIYPNPTHSTITINGLNKSNSYTLKIIDAVGKLISQQGVSQELNKCNVEAFDNGFYLIEISDSHNNLIQRSRLIKN